MMRVRIFDDLFAQYPEIIAQMQNTFTSHQFILELARQHQALYINALYAYRDRMYRQHSAPFFIVHGNLAKHLNAFPELVRKTGQVNSNDIFGRPNRCESWQKI
jgi:hypothetical protein